MEYIVFTSSAGTDTQSLLNLFINNKQKTITISIDNFTSDSDLINEDFIKKTVANHLAKFEIADSPTLPLRIVLHGAYNDKLVRSIFSSYNNVKGLFVFDTPDSAVVAELSSSGSIDSLDTCLKNWEDSISHSVTFAEESAAECALIDMKMLSNKTLEFVELLNNKLGIQLSACQFETQNYSSITRLIASSILLNRDELMAFYDDAKTFAVTLDHGYQYTEASSLLASHSANAYSEYLNLINELDISLLISKQQQELHELNIHSFAAIQQKLDNTENELEIALLQINQLQEEMEQLFDKYQIFERFSGEDNFVEKILRDSPLVQLLRQHSISKTKVN